MGWIMFLIWAVCIGFIVLAVAKLGVDKGMWGLVVFISILLIAGAGIGSWGYTSFIKGPSEVPAKVTSAENIIATYDKFFNRYANIQALSDQIPISLKQIEQFKIDHAGDLGSYVNGTELARLNSVAQGQMSLLASEVRQYNNDAQSLTKKFFKDKNLPSSITIDSNGYTIRPSL